MPDFLGFSPILKPSQIDNAINVNNVQVVKPEPINNAPDVAAAAKTGSSIGPDGGATSFFAISDGLKILTPDAGLTLELAAGFIVIS